jgi:cellulose binding protein with CBM2 domain
MVFSWGTIGGHRADLGGRCECPEVASRVTAGFSFGDSAETIASSWSATVSQSGQKVSTSNASYDGAIPAGGSVTWGMVAAVVTRCCPGYLVLSRERPIRYLNCHSGFPSRPGRRLLDIAYR